MTEPLNWPYAAANARDAAAENIQAALLLVAPVVMGQARDDPSRLLKALFHLSQALRWLESWGAKTRPENF